MDLRACVSEYHRDGEGVDLWDLSHCHYLHTEGRWPASSVDTWKEIFGSVVTSKIGEDSRWRSVGHTKQDRQGEILSRVCRWRSAGHTRVQQAQPRLFWRYLHFWKWRRGKFVVNLSWVHRRWGRGPRVENRKINKTMGRWCLISLILVPQFCRLSLSSSTCVRF